MLPSSIQIGPYRYVVLQDDDGLDDVSCYGDIKYGRQTIRVSSKLSAERQAAVLLHEVIHGCLELNGVMGSDAKAEAMIERCAAGLLDTMRRNPPLVAFLVGES